MGIWQVSDYGGGWKMLFGARNAALLAVVCALSTSLTSAFSLSLNFSSTINDEVLLSQSIIINKYHWVGIPNEG